MTKDKSEGRLSHPSANLGRRDFGADRVLLFRGDDPRGWLDLSRLEAWRPSGELDAVVFWKLDRAPDNPLSVSPLGKAWKQVFRQALVPFDPEQRRTQLAHAYLELKEDVSRWEEAGMYGQDRKRDGRR